ncbi:glycosyltransferase [Castellaniella sp. UC4442_H9]
MKIGVVLDQNPRSGGGFQQSINAVQQLLRICPKWITIEVFTTAKENVTHPALADIEVFAMSSWYAERMKLRLLAHPEYVLSEILARVRVVTSLEKLMLKRGVDLAYLLGPSTYALSFRSLPYVLTVWDLCHRDHPEFPEVSDGGEFSHREHFYRNAIGRSYITLTDSEELSNSISRRYGIEADRLIAMPFQPAASIAKGARGANGPTIVDKLKLPSNYLFYPAQFWAHKNHIRIVQALEYLKREGLRYPVVFCGRDKGNMRNVLSAAEQLGIADQVYCVGFVEDSDMQGLYAHSKAVVMPTYFGPTNLPPLEAWLVGKPLIYSSLFAKQVGDAALCIDPDSFVDLASAIRKIYLDGRLIDHLLAAGTRRLREIDQSRLVAENNLVERLGNFNNRKSCWRFV